MTGTIPRADGPDPPTFRAGAVTRAGDAPSSWPDRGEVISAGPAGVPFSGRRAVWWYAGTAATILVIGLVAVLVMVGNGSLGDGRGPLAADQPRPRDARPPLARLCPPPTVEPDLAAPEALPAPVGERTVDATAGISYRSYGKPWQEWPFLWRAGTLGVPYRLGQYFQTEDYGGGYYATILSAAVPAAVNDSYIVDLECTGRQVSADVRAEYYPRPNRADILREERTTLGGRPAWVSKFRLHFDSPGLRAKEELAAVALIDVDGPNCAVLYVSVPGTNHEWDWVVDDVLTSVRPT